MYNRKVKGLTTLSSACVLLTSHILLHVVSRSVLLPNCKSAHA